MNYTRLGNTELEVSVVGLGCGGPSRLGQRGGKSTDHSVRLVRQALDLGVNFLDTAENYGTEEIVRAAIRDVPRDRIVISTKKIMPEPDHPDPAGFMRAGVEASLERLGTDYVDVFHLHGVSEARYDFAANVMAPVLTKLREEGKIRAVGITEEFPANPRHEMLRRGLRDPWWDVVMVGFNLLNPSARRSVFPLTREKGVGTLVMFAVRRALSQPVRLARLLVEMEQNGLVAPGADLGFLTDDGCAGSLTEAAYRFCVHEPGADVVLTGTGDEGHLAANIEAALKPPLPAGALERLEALFGDVDSVTGN
ncbi:MAG: aldo/keto reductase [Deltaproteobacteria bacterium]|nr:aldo/keto reductase [Deltaproteobacteria bacterium]